MTRRITALLAGSLLLMSGTATAQQYPVVTVRDITQVSQDSIDVLVAAGTGLSLSDIDRLVQSPLADDTVQVTVVLLTDPFLSGLRSVDNPGTPDEKVPIQGFVRDTSAATLGPEGMGMQILTEEPASVGLLDATFGDIITLEGFVDYFSGGQMNFEVLSVTLLGNYAALGFSDDLIAPVTVTTSAINAPIDVGGGVMEVQANWDNFNSLNQQFVRIENAKVWDRTLTTTSNPHILVSSDNGATYLQFDTRYSVRYNNSRIDSYPDAFLTRDSSDPYEPPAIGSTVNVQGFAFYQSTSFEFGSFGAEPNGAWLALAPFTDADVEVIAAPSVTKVVPEPLNYVPGANPAPVTATIESQPGAVAGAVVKYTASNGASGSVDMADQGAGTWSGDVPSLPDGTFVSYSIEVTDTDGIIFTSEGIGHYRVLFDGIDEIEDIQLTADEKPGDSPFVGNTLAMDITATVQNLPDSSGWWSIQDKPALDPWSGILLRDGDANVQTLKQGDVVNITQADVEERFEGTWLRNLTFTVTGQSAPFGYKTVPTGAVVDQSVAEAHEGMLLRFENVTIIDNDAGFGEWTFSSDTPQNAILGSPASDAISSSYAPSNFASGETYSFIQGIWWFSFGSFRVIPETVQDIGAVTNVATDELEVPSEWALEQNYPNPFNPSTTIQYDVPTASHVTMEVYDMIGRRVTTLVDGAVSAGTHSVTFDAHNLASGLYIYRLEAPGSVINRSMMLLK